LDARGRERHRQDVEAVEHVEGDPERDGERLEGGQRALRHRLPYVVVIHPAGLRISPPRRRSCCHRPQCARMPHTPSAMATAASARTRVTRSRSTTAPSAAPNTIEVSRTAATAATGARVIAHSASVYEATEHAPPS